MSVIIPIPIEEVEEEQEQPSLTYRLDLDRGRIFGKADGIEAVNQAIRKALITPRFHCAIYGNQYGSEIKEMIIADDVTPEYIDTELPRLVEDALSADSRILDIYDFSYKFADDQVFVSFKASTVLGEILIEEVL